MLALRPIGIRTSSILGLTLLLGACFDPDPTPLTSESDGTTTDDPTVGTTCDPGEEQACTCEDGSAGTQTCSGDGSGFGACECGSVDSTTASTDPTTDDSTTGPPPECTEASDCNQAKGQECQIDVCVDGVCMVEYEPDGTECGDQTETECDLPDSCFRGVCSPNEAPSGTACTDCPLGVCSCAGGICGDCDTFAPENNFITTRSIDGWTLSGGWALYREAPQSTTGGPIVFGNQVFGTDGNRSTPYPGAELEQSSARSGPVVLPATLEFLSWNVDEGGAGGGASYDTKQINVSTDGGATFVTIADCTMPLPFCNFRDETRAPDDWDAISIPMPPELVNQVGIIELTYNTNDSCCGFERGWFIDVTNFATECACSEDAGCAALGGECGAGVCGGAGECELDAVAAGTDCGDATAAECNAADACDGVGYCAPNVTPNGLTECAECNAGAGACNGCQEGVCADCASLAPTNDFIIGSPAFAGWVIEDLTGGSGADWAIYDFAPQSQVAGSTPTALSFAPSFGIDGNRVQPYPGLELEHSRITTTPDTVPNQITFASWNVDEGQTDNKIIEISVDGGVSWTVLVDCISGVGGPQPFCLFRQDPRLGTEWDNVVINTAAFAGQVGQLRFTYNTQDACCNFERGWFIDNLNFAEYCNDPQFPI